MDHYLHAFKFAVFPSYRREIKRMQWRAKQITSLMELTPENKKTPIPYFIKWGNDDKNRAIYKMGKTFFDVFEFDPYLAGKTRHFDDTALKIAVRRAMCGSIEFESKESHGR